MGKLVLFEADGTARDIKLDRERVTIGRRPDNDVCLPQPAVSGEHVAVVTILSDSFLEDLGSTNGTLVNGNPVTKHFLHDGDEIDIGREILVYLANDSAKPEAPPRRPNPPEGAGVGDARDAVAPGSLHDKRRSDGVAAFSGHSPNAIQRSVAAEIEGEAVEGSDSVVNIEETPTARADPVLESVPMVRVLSGSSAGRVMSLRRSEMFVGRAGVQVAAFHRTGDGIRVVPVEGITPPSINGMPVAPEGQRFGAGDVLEIAGATLELVTPADAGG